MKNNNYKLISAIIQIVLSLALVGISIYYFIVGHYVNFALFLGVGVIFIGLSVRTILKWYKEKKDAEKEDRD